MSAAWVFIAMLVGGIGRFPLLQMSAAWVFIAMIVGGIGITAMLIMIPFYAIWTAHKRQMEEIKARQRVDISEETRAALRELREEMARLRDTTTQYDVSMDTALQRIESRLSGVEQRVRMVETDKQTVGINQS